MNRMFSVLVVLAALAMAPYGAVAGPVDVNTADAATLAAELTGVGPALAEAIVRDREQNGRFTSPESLMRVRGIGERIVEMNRQNIVIVDNEERR
jgi:competence protein ComEA